MYRIQTRPHTYFTGTIDNGSQVLFGLRRDTIAVLVFDQMGDLREAQEYALDVDLTKGLGPDVEMMVEKRIYALKKRLGVRNGPICVKPFSVSNVNVRLQQFPLDLQEFLSNPDDYSEEDAVVFRSDIEEWENAGNCVLYWGNDYLLGRDGRTL